MAAKRSKKQIANDRHRVLWFTPVICSVQVPVVIVDPAKVDLGEDDTAMGCFVAQIPAILVNSLMSPDLIRSVTLHEMTHAAFFYSGSKFAPIDASEEEHNQAEEDVTNKASSLIYDMLTRNSLIVFPPLPEKLPGTSTDK